MNRDANRAGPVPEWLLERLRHNELGAEEAAEVRRRLQAEPDGEARLAALGASDREILARLPPQEVAAEVRRRLARTEQATAAAPASTTRQRPSYNWAFSGLALGAAGVLVLLVGLRAGGVVERAGGGVVEPEITREKGLRPQLAIYRKNHDSAERLAPGDAVRPGDVLQLAYVSAGKAFGVVVSIDGRGTVTPHLPVPPGPAVRLAERRETLLPHAYGLDSTPGFERFLLVTADKPFDTAVVIESMRAGGHPLPAEFSTVDITLRKETP